MKICYLCADPGVPVYGRKGCSTHVRETCLALGEMGHEVRLICANAGEDYGPESAISIQEVEPYVSKKIGFDLRRYLTARKLTNAARKVIRDWKPDAIYERYSLYSEAGNKLTAEFGLPGILEINAFISREQRDRIRFSFLAEWMEKRIFSRAPSVIVVSEPLIDEIAPLRGGGDTITHMPMAVNADVFRPGPPDPELIARFGLDGKFVIGYLGTLTSWHGIDLLHDLSRQLREIGSTEFRIMVVGGDTRRIEAHREKARQAGQQEHVLFTGAVSFADVPRYLNTMDIAVIPDSTYWSSPAKLFEYQGCGLPVVAPDYRAMELAMKDGEEGFIFKPRDVGEMAERIHRLEQDSELRAEMGRKARMRAEKFHSWKAQAQRIVEILSRQAKH